MKSIQFLATAFLGFSMSAFGQVAWTGATSSDVFEESNWDLTSSAVTAIDPNLAVDDDINIVNSVVHPAIPDLPGQGRFQIADGRTLTLDNATLLAVGNDGVGGEPGTTVGITILVTNGSSFDSFFIVNQVDLRIDSTSTATFRGGGNPINLSTVDLAYGAVVGFKDEDVAAFNNEHASKFTVAGMPAIVGVNLDVISDGVLGCIVKPGGSTYNFCDPGNLNCNGVSTTLTGTLGSGLGSGLHLSATNGPNLEFGYFLVSAGFADPGITLSNGQFCLFDGVNPFARYNVTGGAQNSVGQFSADGMVFNNFVGTGTSESDTGFDVPINIPMAGSPMISAGSTWHFQLWHRDGCVLSGASNFSNGLSVVF